MTESSTKPITLTATGEREVVDEAKAEAMIEGWTAQLLAYQAANPDASVLCDEIVLTNKSYTSPAARLIAAFLTSTETFTPCIAAGIKIANLADIIASRMEEEGLEVLKTLSDAFQTSQLVEVDLSDNAMGSKGVVACEMVLGGKAVAGSLQKLSLCNNGLSEFTMEEVAQMLTDQGSGNNDKDKDDGTSTCIASRLTKIHFFNNMSGNQGCESFRKIMQQCTGGELTDVRFSGTRARAEGSAHIAQAFRELSETELSSLANITRLDLADNSFGACYEDVAKALETCSKLDYLDLHDCCLGDDGIVTVCNALLAANPPLAFLSFSGNDIGADNSEGSKHIAKLIRAVRGTLVTFHASENELKSTGIRRIAKAFQSGKNDTAAALEEILLNQNECGTIGAEAIIALAEDGNGNVPNLKKIELDANSFLPAIVDKLESAFGSKLTEMEDNIDDEDGDDELDDEDLADDEEDAQESGGVKEQTDAGVDDLAGALGKITV